MARSQGPAAFLVRRNSRLYFRFRLPKRLQAVLRRSEIRLSLETDSISVARESVATALPHVYALKRLNRRMKDLTPEEFKQAVSYEATRIVDLLERTREPALRVPKPTPPIDGFGRTVFGALATSVDTGIGTVIKGGAGSIGGDSMRWFAHIAEHPINRIDELLPWKLASWLRTPGQLAA